MPRRKGGAAECTVSANIRVNRGRQGTMPMPSIGRYRAVYYEWRVAPAQGAGAQAPLHVRMHAIARGLRDIGPACYGPALRS